MLSNITIGQYFPGTSPVHKLDPRTKIVLTVAFLVCIFLAKKFACFAVIALFVLGCCFLSRINLKFLVRGLKPIAIIVIFTFLLNLFLGTGTDVIWKWKFLTITESSYKNALFMAVRLILLVCGSQLLTLTTSPMALTDALERLLKPLNKIHFPVHEMAMMMTIALRFIPTLMEETDKIMKAQAARGADFDTGNLMQKAKAMVPLLVPLFVSAFRRADELAMAMESRCYHGGENRTRMKVLRLQRIDAYAAGVTALVLVLLILERTLL